MSSRRTNKLVVPFVKWVGGKRQILSEIEKYLNLFDDVYDYASTIYHINSELVDKLIESGKRPLDSATNIITYMSLAKEFWNQKHAFIENQLK